MSTLRTREIRLRITNGMNLTIVPPADRWTLYFKWAAAIVNNVRANMQQLQVCNQLQILVQNLILSLKLIVNNCRWNWSKRILLSKRRD